MKHSVHNTQRTLQVSVSAAAIVLGSAAYADTYTLDQSWAGGIAGDPVNDLNISSLNEAIAAAVEGATARVDQTAVSQMNSASAEVDIGGGDVFAVDQGVDIGVILEDTIWNQSAANVTGAATVLGDALAGGSQVAAVSLNTASIDAIEDTSTVDLTQFIQPFDAFGTDLSLTATNAMVAGASFLGTAQIDGGFREYENADGDIVKVFDLDGWDGPPDDFVEWVDDGVQNSQQLAAVSLNTADFLTDSGELTVNLATAQDASFNTDAELFFDPSFDNVRLQAENFALAYAPQPLGEVGDPGIANLDQIAALTVNTLSFGQEPQEGGNGTLYPHTADYNLNIAYDDSESDWTSGQTFNADGAGEIFVYNTAIATTNRGVASTDQTPTGYWSGLQSDYNEFSDLFTPSIDDEIGDVTLEDGSQVAAVTINSISNLGEGDLKITTDSTAVNTGTTADPDWILASGTFEQSITELGFDGGISYPAGDSINQLFGITGEGNIDVDDYEQTAVSQGNTLSSAGGLELGADLEQIVDDVNLGFADGAYANNMVFSTDVGDIEVDDVSQIAQSRFNSVSASEYIGGDLSQDVSNSTFSVLNAFDATVGTEGSVQVAGLDQTGVLQLNSLSADDALAGNVTQSFAGNPATIGEEVTNTAAAGTDFGSSSLDDLNQVAFASINDVSAGTVGTFDISQVATDVDLNVSNSAFSTVDIGTGVISGNVASIDNATQTALGRVNSVSVSVD